MAVRFRATPWDETVSRQIEVDTYEAPTSRALSLTKLPRSEQAAYAGWLRSIQGACDFANLRPVIATARKQRWNVLKTLAHPDPMQLIPLLSF